MVADAFATLAATLDSPFTRTLTLTPALNEFEPTRAIYCNAPGKLTVVFLGDSAPVDIEIEQRGLYRFRIKQVIAFAYNGFSNFGTGGAPLLLGLY